ncbi:MAG: GNAT family N-acetyltransferase [Lachnospiraceae bacterium]|nr:GNAT family N-acetyltransferase [Lachnospiraceae bacterium]
MSKERVYLRLITAADTAKIVTWRNRDFVRKNFIYQKPFTEEGHLTWFHEQVESGQVAQFIICVLDEKSTFPWEIGSVYLRDIDRDAGTAEYGVFIGETEALGRGYGTAAAKLAVAYGFETLHLQKIFLRFLEDNAGARKSYEKAGFRTIEDKKETVALEQGVREVLFMEIERAEWEMTRDREGL